MVLNEFLIKVKGDYQRSRGLYVLLSTPRFQNLYKNATEESLEKVIQYIQKGDKESILNWIHYESGTFPIVKLRHVARDYGIKNYYRKSYHELYVKLCQILSEEDLRKKLLK